MLRRLNRGVLALMAGTAVACAAGAGHADPIKPGQQQGLGLLGAEIPDELKKISADPYAAPGDCQQISHEIAVLDDMLGPDRDSAKAQDPSMINTTVVPLVRSFIPYRNLVRIVTGANRKDAQLTQAAMAGWERRGFLKGLQKHCGAPDAPPALAASAPDAGQPAADLAPQRVEAPAPPSDLPRVTPISNVAPLEATAPDEREAAPPPAYSAPRPAFGDPRPAAYQMTVAAEPGR